MIYSILIIFFTLSTVLTYFYIRHAWQKNWVDTPNNRSSHVALTPHAGGLVFVTLWAIASIIGLCLDLWSFREIMLLLPGTLLVAVTGFCDDHHNLSARWRALFYCIAAILGTMALGKFQHLIINKNVILPLGFYGSIFAVLAIFGSINLFNFMDGLDGLAATEAIFVLSFGSFFMAQSGGQSIAMLTFTLAICVAGFLIWNKPPAKIFMGDIGSTTLGFVIMVLALWGEKQYGIPVLLWFILYGVFLVDSTLTLLRRLLAKEPVYQAHRLHAYQRLHQAGFSHKKTWILVSCVNMVLALLAMGGFYYQEYLLIFALAAFGMLLVLYGWVERVRPMYARL